MRDFEGDCMLDQNVRATLKKQFYVLFFQYKIDLVIIENNRKILKLEFKKKTCSCMNVVKLFF